MQTNITMFLMQIYLPLSSLGIYQKSLLVHGGYKKLYKSYSNTVSPLYIKEISESKSNTSSSVISSLYWIVFISSIQLLTILFLLDTFKFIGVNESFWDSAVYAPLLGFQIIFISTTVFYDNNILVSKRTYYYLIRSAISGIGATGLALFLIPTYEILGAMCSILFGGLLFFLTEYYFSEIKLGYVTKTNLPFNMIIIVFLLAIFFLSYEGFLSSYLVKLLIILLYSLLVLCLDILFMSGSILKYIKSNIRIIKPYRSN